jgi:hypothetical protein
MRSHLKALLCIVLPFTAASPGIAEDLDKAPPSFAHLGRKAVFADFSHVGLSLSFDALNGKARARAVIEFEVREAGMPVFDMIPSAESVTLDGVAVDRSAVSAVKDPDKQSTVRVLSVDVVPNQKHTLEMVYDLSGKVTFSQGTVSAGFFMSDLSDREYWEQYAPTNFEFDQYAQTLAVEISGTDKRHEIFANGEVEELAMNKWQVSYPSYYSTSSFYFHLVKQGRFNVSRSTYQGLAAEIPLTVYSISQSNVSTGMQRLKEYMAELEGTYGAFAHPSFTAYITDSGGGMEYCGATVTSLWALGHETTHSWFARGVMPANGNAGWIDEAIASWRDDNYPRSNGPSRSPRMLGGFSPYKRFTTQDAYSYGADLISDFDSMVARSSDSGMKGVLRDMFATFKRQTITVQMFQGHMEQALGTSLQAFFDKYIYGRTNSGMVESRNAGWDVNWSHHPRPFTQEELLKIR